MTSATQITDRCTYHGEGTFWDAEHSRLLMVDMLAGAIVAVHADGSTSRHEYGGIAAMIRARTGGGFVLAVERGWLLLDGELRPEREVTAFDTPGVRMNEGGCDPAGRLFTGTLAYDQQTGAGTMWRLADGLVTDAFGDVTISNGLQWSASGDSAFYNDTPTDTTWRYEYDVAAGRFGARSAYVDFGDVPGHPDGMAIDAEDGIWVAMFGGSAVRRYDTAGRLTEVVELAAEQVTSCAFGGPDFTTLYISTSRENLPDDEQPAAGAVFAVETGVAGAPLHAFAG